MMFLYIAGKPVNEYEDVLYPAVRSFILSRTLFAKSIEDLLVSESFTDTSKIVEVGFVATAPSGPCCRNLLYRKSGMSSCCFNKK